MVLFMANTSHDNGLGSCCLFSFEREKSVSMHVSTDSHSSFANRWTYFTTSFGRTLLGFADIKAMDSGHTNDALTRQQHLHMPHNHTCMYRLKALNMTHIHRDSACRRDIFIAAHVYSDSSSNVHSDNTLNATHIYSASGSNEYRFKP